MRKSEEGFALGHLAEPVISLGLSLLLGGAFGGMIGRLMAVPSRPFNYVLKRLPPATLARCGHATVSTPRPTWHTTTIYAMLGGCAIIKIARG